ncbi:MAG: restriction endonuclease [Glutamicibacter ardleyensis]
MEKSEILSKSDFNESEMALIDRTKNSGREFVKSAWQKENFALEGWQAKAGMISDRLAPENLEPPRPKGIGCLTYFVVLAVIIGIGRLLVWMFNFPPTPIAVLTMAFTLIAPFVIFAQMLGRSTKRSEWKQNIAFRKILFESFDEGCIQEVKRASRSIPVGLTPEDLSQDQILRLFSPPPVPDCTPREAEFLVADWMQFMGAENVKVTRASQDGGVDVTANGYVVQVKH